MYEKLLLSLGWCPQLLLGIVRQATNLCRTVVPLLAASLETLALCQNVASLSLFCRYYFVDVHLNWLNWFHFLFLKVSLLIFLIDCMIFLLPFLDFTKMTMSAVSFLAQLNSGILGLQNAFFSPIIQMALSLELRLQLVNSLVIVILFIETEMRDVVIINY